MLVYLVLAHSCVLDDKIGVERRRKRTVFCTVDRVNLTYHNALPSCLVKVFSQFINCNCNGLHSRKRFYRIMADGTDVIQHNLNFSI
jgi:hypothetical protein